VRVDDVPGETAYIDVATPLATGLHLVDSPVFDRDGNLYVTFSGSRGQQAPNHRSVAFCLRAPVRVVSAASFCMGRVSTERGSMA